VSAVGAEIQARDRPYLLPGGEQGVLFLHGFGSSPRLFLHLAEKLNADGYTACAPLLPGHGTALADLSVPAQAWLDAARRELDTLLRCCRSVHVVGLSMGGTLATILAADHGGDERLRSVTLMVPGYSFRNPDYYKMDFSDPAKVMTFSPRPPAGDERDDLVCGYDGMTMGGVKSLIDLMGMVGDAPDRITAPVLLLYTAADPVVDPKSCAAAGRRIRSLEETHCYRRSEHTLLLGCNHKDAAGRTVRFIRRHS